MPKLKTLCATETCRPRTLLWMVVPLALSACAQIQSTADFAARDTAKNAVNEAIFTRFPQVPKGLVRSFTECVITHADASEIQSLAADSVVGVDENTAQIVRDVLARPETQTCLRARVPAAALAVPT